MAREIFDISNNLSNGIARLFSCFEIPAEEGPPTERRASSASYTHDPSCVTTGLVLVAIVRDHGRFEAWKDRPLQTPVARSRKR